MALNNYTDKFISLSNLTKFWEGVAGKISAVDAKFLGYYTKGEVDGKVTTINGEISRVEDLFAGYYNKGEVDGLVEGLEGQIGNKLATADFNSTIANYSTISQVEAKIAAAQASDKTAWEAADAALKSDLEGQIASVAHLKLEKVESLASVTSPKTDVIYLVDEDGATGAFVEYIYVDGEWERIGTTAADFTNYYTKSDIDGQVATLNASIGAASDLGQQGIDDAAAALAAAQTADGKAVAAQGEVDVLEGVVAELTTTVGSNKTAAENAIKAVGDKLGAGFDSTNTVAKAIADINTSIENAVAGGVNSVLLKNTDNGTALEASGAGNVELDIKALVEGYATDGDLSSAVATLQGAINDNTTAIETWAGSIEYATNAEIEAIFA